MVNIYPILLQIDVFKVPIRVITENRKGNSVSDDGSHEGQYRT